ncbi:MAG: hypothetical protein ACRDA5_11070 [Clostridium sp.]
MIKDILCFNDAEEIYSKLLSVLDLNDEDTKFLWDDLMEHVLEYSSIRSGWLLLSREDRISKDDARTLTHNTLISSFEILNRYLTKQGKDCSWYDTLGSERKRIGDFACYISYIYSLNAR